MFEEERTNRIFSVFLIGLAIAFIVRCFIGASIIFLAS